MKSTKNLMIENWWSVLNDLSPYILNMINFCGDFQVAENAEGWFKVCDEWMQRLYKLADDLKTR